MRELRKVKTGWCNGFGGMGRCRSVILALILLIPLTVMFESAALAAPRPVRNVVWEGDSVPITGGGYFTVFDEPFVNTQGDVVFNADYYSYDLGETRGGTFLVLGGTLYPIVVSGQYINSDIGTVTLLNAWYIDGPIFNNSGTVGLVIRGIYDESPSGNTAAVLQKTVAGSLTVIAKKGDSVPNTTTGVFEDFDDMSMNNNDDFAFIAVYTEDGGTTFKTGVFLKPSSGALVSIVLDGATLPGTGGGTLCGGEGGSIDGPWVNDSQAVAFKVDCITGGTGGLEGSAFIKRPGYSLESFVLIGDAAPSSIGGTISDFTLGRPALNNSNTLGFTASISGGSVESAIVTKQLGGSPVACVKVGDPAPDTHTTFDGFAWPALNQNGMLVFQADFAGDVIERQGLFTCQNGVVRAVVLQGDPIPERSGYFSTEVEEQSLSDTGQVVFLHEEYPMGVFVSLPIEVSVAVPTLSQWAMMVMVSLLVLVGIYAIRRRRTA